MSHLIQQQRFDRAAPLGAIEREAAWDGMRSFYDNMNPEEEAATYQMIMAIQQGGQEALAEMSQHPGCSEILRNLILFAYAEMIFDHLDRNSQSERN